MEPKGNRDLQPQSEPVITDNSSTSPSDGSTSSSHAACNSHAAEPPTPSLLPPGILQRILKPFQCLLLLFQRLCPLFQHSLQPFQPLILSYSHHKRLFFYDVCFFLIHAPWLLLTLTFWYAPCYLSRALFALFGLRLRENHVRYTILFLAGMNGLVYLRSTNSGEKTTMWTAVVDDILQRLEPGIDQSCGWAAQRILSRQESFNSALATGHEACIPHFCPSTLSWLHHPDPYLVLSLPQPSPFHPPVSSADIAHAYRQALRIWHPDKQSLHHLPARRAEPIIRIIQTAYDTLRDERNRREWDRNFLRGRKLQELTKDWPQLMKDWPQLQKYFEDAHQRPRVLDRERDVERYQTLRPGSGSGSGSETLLGEGIQLLFGWWIWWGRVGWGIVQGLMIKVPKKLPALLRL